MGDAVERSDLVTERHAANHRNGRAKIRAVTKLGEELSNCRRQLAATKEDSKLTRCNMETELQEVIAERDERNEEINMKRIRLKR